jgi:hypothetical protein
MEGRTQKAEGRSALLVVAVCAFTSALCLLPSAFAQAAGWTPHPSDGVEMHLARDGDATRLDFDFHGHGGYAIARRAVDLDLPPNYALTFQIRGDAPPENLELKLVDASGDNVWWLNRRDFVFPRQWTALRTKKRQIAFAWGPAGGGEIHHVAAIEIVVTAGSGGRGTMWFTEPQLEPLPVVDDAPLRFHTSTIDLGERREIGGVEIDWRTMPREFELLLDGVARREKGARFVWLPDAEARRIEVRGGKVAEVVVEPPSWAPTRNDFLSIVAKHSRRVDYPRYFNGEQSYWTVVGADGAENEALVGEDGNVEPFKGGDSIEPFLIAKGRRLTWADVTITQSLADGDLPIPSVTWTRGAVSMMLTAAVSSSSMLQLRYRVRGNAQLALEVRPFQVNPSTQFLNGEGGVARVHNGALRHVARRTRARETEIDIPLAPGAKREPFAQIEHSWREKLNRVAIDIGGAPEIARTIRTNLAYTLVHRDGAAIKPGSRSYDRAWIRDGALLSSILLRLGHAAEAKAFAEWFAGFQYENGKVPCCVDSRGADPVPENDSHGEFIVLVKEIERLTRDADFAHRLRPHVDAAVRYINELRSQNHGAFEGLVTESISHEGYSAKPVHSYWDDVFCLKGLEVAGAAEAAQFRRDLIASMERTAREHHIDYVPASAELGDFDPTSTAIAISPLGLTSLMSRAALERTFAEYLARVVRPRDDYTPYEMRIIGALIRLGDRTHALELIDRFLLDRRPAAWNGWAEVVRTSYRKPGFIGDMPHAWVASDFIRSILDAVAYEAEDGTLVVGAGVPARWLPLHVGPLPTSSGNVEVRMRREGGRAIVELSGTATNIVVVSPFDSFGSRYPVPGAQLNNRTPGTEHRPLNKTQRVRALPARVVFEE